MPESMPLLRTDTVKNALVPNLNILSERSKSIIQNRMAMRHTKQLQHNLNINDLCLMRYSIGDEKKSLLTTVLEVDEFSDYHPVKMVCKVDTDALAALENGISVSLVSKKSICSGVASAPGNRQIEPSTARPAVRLKRNSR